jgi:hypothetical protein
MRRPFTDADRAVKLLFRQQYDIITRPQVLAAGLTTGALRWRIGPDGPWEPLLPGVYLNHKGSPTMAQREFAALLYVGRDGVLTGEGALRRWGLRVPHPQGEMVDVLIPATAQRQSARFVRTHRTTRMPEQVWATDGVRWAPVPRALADAARIELELRQVRALTAEAVQRRKCSVAELAEELRGGPKRGSAALREVLEEVLDGVASVAEGDLRKLVRSGRLPEPLYNPELYVGSEFLARPDLYWPDAGVAGEVDSREWHLSPEDWARTMQRHSRMSARGILVLHFTPSRIRADGQQVLAELRAAIEAGLRRRPLAIRAVPAGANLASAALARNTNPAGQVA